MKEYWLIDENRTSFSRPPTQAKAHFVVIQQEKSTPRRRNDEFGTSEYKTKTNAEVRSRMFSMVRYGLVEVIRP